MLNLAGFYFGIALGLCALAGCAEAEPGVPRPSSDASPGSVHASEDGGVPLDAQALDTNLPDAALSDADLVVHDDDEYLGLKAPANGFRVKNIGTEVPAKSDVEYCEVAELPGNADQEYIVHEVELANARGSHHLIVSAALPGTAADKKLRAMKVGDRVPCIAASIDFGEGLTSVSFTQSPYRRTSHPEGIGFRLRGAQRVVFDYHYFNFGSEPLKARSAMAVHLIEPSKLKNIATSFAFSNYTINTPAHSSKTFSAACHLKQDVWLMNLVRHTHTKSTDFSVWFEGGPRHGELIWTSRDWEHDTEHPFPAPIRINEGEGFKFSCSFVNDQTKPLRFGTSAADEMCILNGIIWSPTEGAILADESCVTTWLDKDGVSHDATDYGGVPKAEPGDALACHAGTFGVGLLDPCLGCICDSCATVIARCTADVDCKALYDCTSSCSGDNCLATTCKDEFFEHSSATGMITAVGDCVRGMCPACAPAASDAGVPDAGP